MELDFEKLNINPKLFTKLLFNNVISNTSKKLKLNYKYNKDSYTERDKELLKSQLATLKGGKIKESTPDFYTFFLIKMYDVVNKKEQAKIRKHVNTKLKNQSGGDGFNTIVTKLNTFKDTLDDSKSLIKGSVASQIDALIDASTEQLKKIAKGDQTNFFDLAPALKAQSVSNDLNKMSQDGVSALGKTRSFDSLLVHLGSLTNIKTTKGDDIKDIVNFLKSNSIFASSYLQNVVTQLGDAGNNITLFNELCENLRSQQQNLKNVTEKMKDVVKHIENMNESLDSKEKVEIFPLDVSIVSNSRLKRLFYGKDISYTTDPESSKVVFKTIPADAESIIKKITEKAEAQNAKIPSSEDLVYNITNKNDLIGLINAFKESRGQEILFSGGASNDTQELLASIPNLTLARIESEDYKFDDFNSMASSRKIATGLILGVSASILEMNKLTEKLIKNIDSFNLFESRQYWYTYTLSAITLNSSNNKTYNYLSFGVLDFYKDMIEKIWNKINYDNAPEILKGDDIKFLFFYYYHYNIIQKLNNFLNKFYVLKDLNIFKLGNTFIDINDCCGDVKDNLSLLNTFKFLLDSFYSKIGLTTSASNVTIYLKINDFPNEKILLGRQAGIISKNSVIKNDIYANSIFGDGSAFIYNVDIADFNLQKFFLKGKNTSALDNIKAKKIADEKNVDDKLKSIITNIIENPDVTLQRKWQQRGGVGKNIDQLDIPPGSIAGVVNDKDFIEDPQTWKIIEKDDENNQLFEASELSNFTHTVNNKYDFASEIDVNTKLDKLKKEVFYKPKSNAIKDIWKEREEKRLYLVNRKVQTIIDDDYTKDYNNTDATSTVQFLIDMSGTADNSMYINKFREYNGKNRPLIAKITFFPLLEYITSASKEALGLVKQIQDIGTDISSYNIDELWKDPTGANGFDLKTLKFEIHINDGPVKNFEFATSDAKKSLNFYGENYNADEIYKILLIGFLPFSQTTTPIELTGKDYISSGPELSMFKSKLELLKINKFKLVETGNSNKNFASDMNIVLLNKVPKTADYITTQNNEINIIKSKEPLTRYHWLLKNRFRTLFYEPTPQDRDDSEYIFKNKGDKYLVIENPQKCQRLLDRHTNEDDYNAVMEVGERVKETKFNHVFSNEKCPDNESVGMFMSIPSQLSNGNGYMLLTFGYSGTGKTVTVFGKKDPTGGGNDMNGILQTALGEVEKKDNFVYFRCYEMYGIGLPYSSYWYDKMGKDYDPHRIELLIHHRFKNDNSLNYESNSLHVFDDPKLRAEYLNNNNWFYPDAGSGSYRTVNREEYIGKGISLLSGNPVPKIIYGTTAEEIMFKEDDFPPILDDARYIPDPSKIYKSFDDILNQKVSEIDVDPTDSSYNAKYNDVIKGKSGPPLIIGVIDDATKRVGYVRYDNGTSASPQINTKYFAPRIYSSYKGNKINNVEIDTDVNVTHGHYDKLSSGNKDGNIPLTPVSLKVSGSINRKNNIENIALPKKFKDYNNDYVEKDSTYIKLNTANITNFPDLIKKIDTNRGTLLGNSFLYNNNGTPPSEYDIIKRIKETANNPESSRSIIFYEFVMKLKEPKRVKIQDEYGRDMFVWRYFVTLIIVDLPGQEDIKSSFVEKPKYDLTQQHKSTFTFERESGGKQFTDSSLDASHIAAFNHTDRADNESKYYFTRKYDKDGITLDNAIKDKVLHDTTTDPDVYKYNELFQKIIKASVYMNPLFKFMSYMDPTNTDNLTNSNSKQFGLGLSLVIVSGSGKQEDGSIDEDSLKYGFTFGCGYETTSIKRICDREKAQNIKKGSKMFQSSKNYIDGLILLQTNPLKYIKEYLLDIAKINDKSDLLAPFESITINTSVAALIDYLAFKTQGPTRDRKIPSTKTQHFNFANHLIDNKKLPNTDFSDSNSTLEELAKDALADGADSDANVCIHDDFLTDNIVIRNVSFRDIDRDLVDWILLLESDATTSASLNYVLTKKSSSIIDPNQYKSIIIDGSVDYRLSYGDTSKIKGYYYYDGPSQTGSIKHKILPNKLPNHLRGDISSVDKITTDASLRDTPDNIYMDDEEGNPTNMNSVNFADKKKFKYEKSIVSGAPIFRGINAYWFVYYVHLIKYLMLIDIFVIHNRLRSLDKYYRTKIIPNNDEDPIKYVNTKDEFTQWFDKLKMFYQYYIGVFIDQKQNASASQYVGIYSKNKVFCNNQPNEFLEKLKIYFYKYKNDYSDTYIFSKQNLLESNPELDMMHVKPPIIAYLEPYAPYLDKYSLLYIMSNNDPHIKCHKQMDLIDQNKDLIRKIVQGQ